MARNPFDDGITSISIEPTTDKPLATYLIAPIDADTALTDEQFERVRRAVGNFTTRYFQAGEMEMFVRVSEITDPATGQTRKGIEISATEDAAKDIASVFAIGGNRLAGVELEIVDERNQAVPQLSLFDRERIRREQAPSGHTR